MNKYPGFSALLNLIIIITLVLCLTACASAPEGEASSASSSDDDQTTEYHYPRLLGYILDPDGEPVAYAEVGGEDIATEDGVASGDFLDYQGGWIPVTALGYASSYAKDSSEDLDFPFFVTYLTPYQSMGTVESENPITLRGIYQDETHLSAELTAELFQGPSVVVGMALIDPYHVRPIMEPFSEGEGLTLISAFALEAFDEDWLPVDLIPGSVIPLTLKMPAPLSEGAKFARFDREAGEWQSMDLGCEIAEGNIYSCYLDTLDPLIGIFDQAENLNAGISHLPREGSATFEGEANYWDDLAAAIADLQDWINDQEWGVEHDNPELIALVEKIAKIAHNYAKNNRNESGKSMLAEAAEHAGFGMQEGIVKELTDEMASIAEEVAKNALKETDCGEYRKMRKAAEQVQLLKADFSLADQLMEKVNKMVVDCDLWTGTVRVRMSIPSTHPSGLDLDSQNWGAWYEIHTVKISTNVETLAMYGEGKIAQSYPEVTFSRSDPCPKEITVSGSGGDAWVVFKGRYDGYSFYIDEINPEGVGASINHTWRTEAKQDGECKLVREHKFSFPNFFSLILHGVSSGSPTISYYEILDTGSAADDSKGLESFSGGEKISNPDPEMGVLPFVDGEVWWRFHHTVWVLPIKNEK